MHARHTSSQEAGRAHAIRFAIAAALLAALASPAPVAATIGAAPDSATVVQGGTGPLIQLAISGADNPLQVPVDLVIAGLPPGVTTVPSPVTATFPSPVTGSASFRFDIAPGTAPGVYPVTVAGPGGFMIGSVPVTLTVPTPAVSVAPGAVTVEAGETSPGLTVSVTNVTDQTLSFAPTLPGPLAGNTTVQPSPVAVTVPNGPTTGAATFSLATSPATPPGSYTIPFLDPVSGLGFAVGLQVSAAPMTPVLTASPAEVSVGPAALGPPVTLTLEDAPAGSYPLSVALPGALAGNATVEPAVPTIVVPADGVAASTVLRVRTGAASPPGLYTLGVSQAGLGVATDFALRVQGAEGAASIAPAAIALAPGQTSGPLSLRVSASNLGGRTLEFRPQGAPGLQVEPATVRVQIPPGGAPAEADFRVTATAGAAPGAVRLLLAEPAFGLAAAMTVTVQPPRAAISVTPARVTLAPGGTSDSVTLRVADSNLGGRRLRFRLADPGAAPGLSLVPAEVSVTVPPGGGPASVPLRVAASSAAAPGFYALTLAEVQLPELRTTLTAEVERPVTLERLEPRALAQGTVDARLRLVGSGFQPGATVVSSGSPRVTVREVRVLSPTLAEASVSVHRDAPVGAYPLDLVNPDGSRSVTPALLAVIDRGALTAPVGVETVAVVHPAPGAAVAIDDAVYPRGLIATTGTGTLVGSWRLDGVPFDRFVVQARGGEPAAVDSRLPIPRSALGRHRLELAVESPVELVGEPVELLQVVGRASRLTLHAPAPGAVGRGSGLLFRWSAVPGAVGYQVEILGRAGRPPLLYRVPAAEWRPRERDLEAVGTGLRRWRVRPLLAGGVEGEASAARRFVVVPESLEPALHPVRREADGALRLAWEDAGPGVLYRVEVWGKDEESPLHVALTAETGYRLPEASWSRRARSWRLVVLGPGGVVLGASERTPLPAGASGAGVPFGGRGDRRIVFAAQTASTGSGTTDSAAAEAATVAVETRSPAPGVEVVTAYPRIEASWSSPVAAGTVSLLLDDTDVTLVAAVGPSSLTYESLLPLAPGEHRVEVWLGGTRTGWTFSVAESASGGAGATPPPAEPAEGADAPAWLVAEGATGASDAGVAYDLGAATGTGEAVGATGGWADWQLAAEGTLTRLSADDLEADESSGSALLSGQVDYRSGDGDGSGMESGGSSFAKGTGDVGVTETFEGASPDQESRSWVLGGGLRRRRSRQEVSLGYASPDFLFGSELLSDGLPQGGGQATAGFGPASLSYYRTFDPDFGGSLSGAFGPSLDLEAGALTVGDGSGRFQLRAVGLETDEDGDGFAPGGEGSVVGVFTSLTLTSALSLILEGARGDFTPASGSLDSERAGNAFRLGATGLRGPLSWGVSLRYSEAGFVNPAARGLTAGVIADRAGADLTLTRNFAGGATLGVELRHLRGGTDSGLDSSDARQDGGVVRYSTRLGPAVRLSLAGNYMSTRGGGDDELGLPDSDRTDRGAQVALTESWGGVSFSQTVTWQQGEDAADPARDQEVLNTSLSANATVSPAFSLFGQLDGLRNESGGPFGGVTETLLASLQPTWTLAALGLTVQPYAAYNRLENDLADGATESESYRLLISWTPPRLGRYLGFQASADWSRTSVPGLPDPDFAARYTASLTLRWNGSGRSGAGAAAGPEHALLPQPLAGGGIAGSGLRQYPSFQRSGLR